MLASVLILILTLFIAFFIPNYHLIFKQKENKDDTRTKKLWTIAQTAMNERKPARAEKALLSILKFDERNAAAYNRLGIIYAKEKHYEEAIECFEIAQSLDNNASSLHNVGLIYFETGDYEKAAQAFKKAIEVDGGESARHIAYAKTLEKLGKRKQAVEALENAYELKQDTSVLKHLLELYTNDGDEANIKATKDRIRRLEEKKQKLLGYKIDKTSAKTMKGSRADKENARASARAAKIMTQAEAKARREAALKKQREEREQARKTKAAAHDKAKQERLQKKKLIRERREKNKK